jgi:hypothetical protein
VVTGIGTPEKKFFFLFDQAGGLINAAAICIHGNRRLDARAGLDGFFYGLDIFRLYRDHRFFG